MDVKIVLFIIPFLLGMCLQVKTRVVFNFHEKLRLATSTTAENLTDTAQVIRIPELDCPLGQRRDGLGNCRQRL